VNVRALSAAAFLVGLLAVSGATAATQRHVLLTVWIAGSGTVRLSDGHHLACSSKCYKTFSVGAGAKLNLAGRPGSGWILSRWDGACRGTKPTCGLRLRRGTLVAATFGPPGSTSANPIPLGHAVTFKDGWNIKVVSTTFDATAQIVAIPGNRPPPPGAQYTMVNLSATYTGGGSSVLDEVGDRFETVGAHNFAYDTCYEQLPPPVLSLYATVFSGQTESGNVCYQIASNDAPSLELKAYGGYSTGYVWFALR
jgi:hypothetical protein